MSTVFLTPASLYGTVAAPCSKSAAHRALICAFLAGGGAVCGIIPSDDIQATQDAITALQNGDDVIDCRESASTLRFFIPTAAALGKTMTFIGSERLSERPIDAYLRLLPAHGVSVKSNGGLPLTMDGRLTAGTFTLEGNVSSQYVTGLLLALPLTDGDSRIVLTSPLQSKPYADLTVKIMRDYGVIAEETNNGYYIKGNQTYQPRTYAVEGDWSQAAFFLVGGALTGNVTVTGLDFASKQGDKQITKLLRRFGAAVMENPAAGTVTVQKSALHGIRIDAADIPDLVPILAVAAAYAAGTTVITGCRRLQYKESDRLQAVVENLNRMGVRAAQTSDGMVIEGGKPHGAALLGYNDHRMVMAFSVAALCAEGETTVSDVHSVRKSYPAFFEEYQALGGKSNVIRDREQP